MARGRSSTMDEVTRTEWIMRLAALARRAGGAVPVRKNWRRARRAFGPLTRNDRLEYSEGWCAND